MLKRLMTRSNVIDQSATPGLGDLFILFEPYVQLPK